MTKEEQKKIFNLVLMFQIAFGYLSLMFLGRYTQNFETEELVGLIGSTVVEFVCLKIMCLLANYKPKKGGRR